MDFVDWDAAASGTGFDMPSTSEGVPPSLAAGAPFLDPNMDLVFENVDGDDWSFWAMEHYESTQGQISQDLAAPAPAVDPIAAAAAAGPASLPCADTEMNLVNADAPCYNCAAGNYQCKRIREGEYKGYCTSCVALRRECSFRDPDQQQLRCQPGVPCQPGASFPANPWPIMGDRPSTTILIEDEATAMKSTAPGLVATSGAPADNPLSPLKAPEVPKVGPRFSREAVKILKNWVSTHSKHPYPTDEEKEGLQKLTGLNKTQITNWLANARRRGKIQPTRATSPHVGRGYAQAIDIPQRRGTPALFESMNPLQRWANSPPENEPASATAIARAVSASNSYSQTSGSGRNSPFVSNFSDDSRSVCQQSSASSLGTSQSSGGSFASSYSHKSRGSLGSVPSFARGRARRRRRRAPAKQADEPLTQPLKTFQCTFCTETFRTKHDWQRHEKSLHLSLERWVCCPEGPRAVNPENGLPSCVFCGEKNPDEAHVESHSYSACLERAQEERTFYRKDHLRQHLKLVHNVKFLSWSMDRWRAVSPQIRSRCGFCGIVMDTWSFRTDHLAEHFKTGNTMADWKGDWGFEAPVLDMVENSIPPYLIHDERRSPLPFIASNLGPTTPSTAFELLKVELQHWIVIRTEETFQQPTDDEIQHEACRIIFGAEALSPEPIGASPSWLRDVVLSASNLTQKAQFDPIRHQSENKMSHLRINGKRCIFQDCDFERQLQDFVRARQLLGLTAMDEELQFEACRVVGRAEERSNSPSDALSNWLLRLIHKSTGWLENFRQRAHLPRSEDVSGLNQRSKDPKTIDSTIHNYSRLERELGEYLEAQRSQGAEPTDAALQRQARTIIYDVDDEWNQTAADDVEWLQHFRQRHETSQALSNPNSTLLPGGAAEFPGEVGTGYEYLGKTSGTFKRSTTSSGAASPRETTSHVLKAGPYFLNDANCYRRLAQNLTRYVKSAMSPNNPSRHVPTDEELQYQARWVVYDDDDPWNWTAADNVEWLQRFKADVGILPSGPGLTESTPCWSSREGGTGFAPPYVYPNPAATIEPLTANPKITFRDESKTFEPDAETANHFLQHLAERYPAPAKIFCSRELEKGLREFVKRELMMGNQFPDDECLKNRARQIMSMQKTSCDDPVLLERFKASMRSDPVQSAAVVGAGQGNISQVPGSSLGASLDLLSGATTASQASALPTGMDMSMELTEQSILDILEDTRPELDGGAPLFDPEFSM